MYCIKCGTSNDEEARFCSFCGEAMTAEAVSAPAKEENATAPVETVTAEASLTEAPAAKAAADAPTAPESVSYAPEAATLPSTECRRKSPLGIVLGVMSGTAVALFGVIVYLLARDGHF